jgi:hypothetical protein
MHHLQFALHLQQLELEREKLAFDKKKHEDYMELERARVGLTTPDSLSNRITSLYEELQEAIGDYNNRHSSDW